MDPYIRANRARLEGELEQSLPVLSIPSRKLHYNLRDQYSRGFTSAVPQGSQE